VVASLNARMIARVAALLLSVSCTFAVAACDLSYRLTPHLTGPSRYIDVELTWRAGDSRTTELTLTPDWGGVRDLAKSIRDFRARSTHQWVLDRADPTRKTVTHLPKERITVRYRVDAALADPDNSPISRRDVYTVLLGPDWFHFVGYAVFAMPEEFGGATRPRMCVSLDRGTNDGWIITSFGARQAPSITFTLRDSPERLRHAVYFGGSFDVRRRDVHGRAVLVARRGTWGFDMDGYADTVTRLVTVHREFWKDFNFPPFTVELLPMNQRVGNFGGTGLANAFVVYAPDDFTIPGEQLDFLFGHEHLHTWLPHRFGAMGEDEALRYWFSEGFTDFYARRLLVQSGDWTIDRYADALNRKIRQYLMSDARAFDNERVKADFFSDSTVGALAYQRGEFLALRWHAKLSERRIDGLDGVMRSLLLPRNVDEYAKPAPAFATARLLDKLDSVDFATARDDVERFIERGEIFTFDAATLGPCFEMRTVETTAFQLGFDRRQSVKAAVLVGVEPDGPAYAAGLRDGQPIAGFHMYEGDVTKDVFVQLRDGEAKGSEVHYLPASRERRTIPVYTPKGDAAGDPACRAWFGNSAAST
jgi:predicted metalloprotease with PDZ domain